MSVTWQSSGSRQSHAPSRSLQVDLTAAEARVEELEAELQAARLGSTAESTKDSE